MDTETEWLREKTSKWAKNMFHCSLLVHNEAWLNYTHTITKTLEYPMSANTMTLKQWKYVMAPANQAALAKSGVVRTLAHPSVYGPKKYQGLGAMEPFHHQELTHLYDLVQQTSKDSPHGIQLRATIEALRMETEPHY